MTDILARDQTTSQARTAGAPFEARSGTMNGDKKPRSDAGTVFLHWMTAVTFLTCLFTGLRIAGDNLDATVAPWLSPILPQGEIWTWHFVSGLCLFFCVTAYTLYMRRSGLSNRSAPKRIRVFFLPVVSKLRFSALTVGLHWLLYVLVLVLTGTGIMLYLGYGNWWVYVHSTSALIAIAYIFAHLASHFGYGGWQQLLRIFRPAKLVVTSAMRPRPLLIGSALGILAAVTLAAADFYTRDTLVIRRVSAAPQLERLLDDPAWRNARAVKISTHQGVNLGGTGASMVEVRAVHDSNKIYFAFRWEDPSRSLRRIPMIKKEDGWHVTDARTGFADVNDFYEDKLAVIFSNSSAFGSGASTYMGPKPLDGAPAPLHKRGFHYTSDGSYIDMWQWKASRGGLLGFMDDQYIGPPRKPTEGEAKGADRYQAGYWNDPGKAFYSYNYVRAPEGGKTGPVKLKVLPKDLGATVAALGKFDLNPDSSDTEGARWWMTAEETVGYSKELDDAIPLGTVLPGVLIAGNYEGDRGQINASARWQDGHWTVVASRDLRTASQFDKDFAPNSELYMWVAVFDHTQTRHTRHPRPVKILVQE